MMSWCKETNRPGNWEKGFWEIINDATRIVDYLVEEAKKEGRKELIRELQGLNNYQRFGFEDGTLLIYRENWQELIRELE